MQMQFNWFRWYGCNFGTTTEKIEDILNENKDSLMQK